MIENSIKSTQFIEKSPTDKSLIKETFLSTTQDAFNEALKGNKSKLFSIIDEISSLESSDEDSKEQLIIWMETFSKIVSNFTQEFQDLVGIILDINWVTRSSDFAIVYSQFLENLVSAHAFYMFPVAERLINLLCWKKPYENPRAKLVSDPSVTPKIVCDRVHAVLKRIISLIPSGPSFLINPIAEAFPDKFQDTKYQLWYLKNILRMIEYIPVLKEPILSLIVEKIIKIDVEIQVEIEDMDDQDIMDLQNLVFKMEKNDVDENDLEEKHEEPISNILDFDDLNDNIEDGFLFDELTEEDSNVKGMVEKLDGMLNILFDYILKLSNEERDDMFEILMEIFQKTILPTHNSRYTQFLIFYLCSFSPVYVNNFVCLLAQKVLTPSVPSVIQVASAAYISSFIARAKYMEIGPVKTMLQLLTRFSLNYIDQNEHRIGSVLNPKHYMIFYSVVEAIILIFLYRWRSLMETEGNGITYGQLPPELKGLDRIIQSRFNPLVVCNRGLVEEFAKLTHNLEIMYCYSIFENKNYSFIKKHKSKKSSKRPKIKMHDLKGSDEDDEDDEDNDNNDDDSEDYDDENEDTEEEEDDDDDEDENENELPETLLPFEPYQLKNSCHFIENIYQNWTPISNDEDDSDIESDVTDNILAMSISPMAPPAFNWINNYPA
ncbi:RNA polymerase I-specific transcription initiation factor RRN3 [Anaeromyces robustus]|uniref:RNA polymerase I-specific transcription initiation factor RRN3 n=1 Tax=Anaeromyces robustus TaxID=1754192 RepID=A0A1Y1WYA9_9FUNG|nr:RNA polymerase I-specific transcription initiation factor RRN3 [Anaeromyces robustus]|eukprot:ORX78432.1 RNA polymerase I-specific transcription initiation factor RRN3 [Anaeromyces robustus]